MKESESGRPVDPWNLVEDSLNTSRHVKRGEFIESVMTSYKDAVQRRDQPWIRELQRACVEMALSEEDAYINFPNPFGRDYRPAPITYHPNVNKQRDFKNDFHEDGLHVTNGRNNPIVSKQKDFDKDFDQDGTHVTDGRNISRYNPCVNKRIDFKKDIHEDGPHVIDGRNNPIVNSFHKKDFHQEGHFVAIERKIPNDNSTNSPAVFKKEFHQDGPCVADVPALRPPSTVSVTSTRHVPDLTSGVVMRNPSQAPVARTPLPVHIPTVNQNLVPAFQMAGGIHPTAAQGVVLAAPRQVPVGVPVRSSGPAMGYPLKMDRRMDSSDRRELSAGPVFRSPVRDDAGHFSPSHPLQSPLDRDSFQSGEGAYCMDDNFPVRPCSRDGDQGWLDNSAHRSYTQESAHYQTNPYWPVPQRTDSVWTTRSPSRESEHYLEYKGVGQNVPDDYSQRSNSNNLFHPNNIYSYQSRSGDSLDQLYDYMYGSPSRENDCYVPNPSRRRPLRESDCYVPNPSRGRYPNRGHRPYSREGCMIQTDGLVRLSGRDNFDLPTNSSRYRSFVQEEIQRPLAKSSRDRVQRPNTSCRLSIRDGHQRKRSKDRSCRSRSRERKVGKMDFWNKSQRSPVQFTHSRSKNGKPSDDKVAGNVTISNRKRNRLEIKAAGNKEVKKPKSDKMAEKPKADKNVDTSSHFPPRAESRCFFKECETVKLVYLKKHLTKVHIPAVYHENETYAKLANTQLLALRKHGLEMIAHFLVGPSATVEQLVRLVNNDAYFINDYSDPLIQTSMRALAKLSGWTVPNHFSISPVNSPAALTHWRPFAFLMSRLSLDQTKQMFALFGQKFGILDKVIPGKKNEIQVKNNVIPVKKNEIPVKKNEIPPKKNVIPGKENVIPEKKNVIPEKKHEKPVKNNVIPVKKNEIPVKKNEIPPKKNVIPGKENVIPEKKNVIPEKKHEKPVKNNVLPVKNNEIPVNNNVIPVKKNVIDLPEKKKEIPVKNNVIPEKNNVIPVKNNVIPEKNNVIPVKNNVIPEKKNEIPVKNNVIPEKNNVIPVPEKKNVIPVKKKRSRRNRSKRSKHPNPGIQAEMKRIAEDWKNAQGSLIS